MPPPSPASSSAESYNHAGPRASRPAHPERGPPGPHHDSERTWRSALQEEKEMLSPTPNMIAEKHGAVGRLIFNKPAKRNATSSDMWEAIPVIMDEFEKDPAIRVVVVTGAGDQAFVSGADISEFAKAR